MNGYIRSPEKPGIESSGGVTKARFSLYQPLTSTDSIIYRQVPYPMRIIKTIEDVRKRHLCTGCGICAALEPDRFDIVDIPAEGRRPVTKPDAPAETGRAFAACPGAKLHHEYDAADPRLAQHMRDAWGPVYQVLEGHAADEEIRFAASSGGAATALALYCLEQRHMGGVLHTGADPDKPYCNRTVFSTDRAALLRATGSRYSPSSPCAELNFITESAAECVFIGKPCDVAAVAAARKQSAELDRNLGLTIAFFCAGVPSTEASLKLAAREGAGDPRAIRQLRYRGNGWPGNWSLEYAAKDGRVSHRALSYSESWSYLQHHRQWRCYICPDHTGEFADISVGDPWYRTIGEDESGSSLIVVRTARGMDIVKGAISAGYLNIVVQDLSLLERSQPDLIATRGYLWARLHTLRLFGVATPDFSGFAFFKFWWRELNFFGKVRSVSGTIKRIFRKQLRKPASSPLGN